MSVKKMLAEARADIGMRGRPNAITRDYASRHGNEFLNAAWCNMGVTKWARDSGNAAAVLPAGDRAYTVWHAQDFYKSKRWYPGTAENLSRVAKPGDIVFFDWGKTNGIGYIDHVGVIEKVRGDGTIVTIEANIGDAVQRKVRDASTVAGFGRPDYGADTDPPPAEEAPQGLKGTKGVDYAWVRPRPSALKREGYTFACRYLSRDASKDLSKAEAKALAAEGIASVVVWETSADRARDGYKAGQDDAAAAARKATACGMIGDRPIYFAVDWDASDAELRNGVTQYFKGVASVIGLARTGVYGGYRSVRYLSAEGLATWFWQTYAWSAGNWFAGNHIEQYAINVKANGKAVDYNRAKADDIGQWYPDIGGAPGKTKPAVKRYWRHKLPNGKTYTVPWGSPTLNRGDKGTPVKWLQESLNVLRDDKRDHLKVDGDFGPVTEAAVRRYQSNHKDENGKRLDVDGEYGNHTSRSLNIRVKGKLGVK